MNLKNLIQIKKTARNSYFLKTINELIDYTNKNSKPGIEEPSRILQKRINEIYKRDSSLIAPPKAKEFGEYLDLLRPLVLEDLDPLDLNNYLMSFTVKPNEVSLEEFLKICSTQSWRCQVDQAKIIDCFNLILGDL